MTAFFTSDTHFNHANIIKYCNRPWATVEEMNDGLIERWNTVVGHHDTVFHLGDFAMGKHDLAPTIFDQLHGCKYLIRGNHDSRKIDRLGWASVDATNMMMVKEGKFFMVHDPANAKASLAPITVLHGHLHGMPGLHGYTRHPHIRYIDVGVDCWDYRPVTLETLLAS